MHSHQEQQDSYVLRKPNLHFFLKIPLDVQTQRPKILMINLKERGLKVKTIKIEMSNIFTKKGWF